MIWGRRKEFNRKDYWTKEIERFKSKKCHDETVGTKETLQSNYARTKSLPVCFLEERGSRESIARQAMNLWQKPSSAEEMGRGGGLEH